MFSRMASEAVLDRRGRLHDVHRAVNAHRGARWHEWRASPVQNHAGNPWAIISLAVAFVLLVLTVVQTVYTVLPYYDQKAQTAAGGGIGLLRNCELN
jgi:hypothetical protein